MSNRRIPAIGLQVMDTVGVVLEPVSASQEVVVQFGETSVSVTAVEAVPKFHKIALRDIAKGEEVTRSGTVIGEASAAIPAGGWLHVHNLRSRRGRRD